MRLDQRIRASSRLTQVSAAGQLLAPHRSALLAVRHGVYRWGRSRTLSITWLAGPGGAPENGVREQDVHLVVRDAGGVGVVFAVERDDVDHAGRERAPIRATTMPVVSRFVAMRKFRASKAWSRGVISAWCPLMSSPANGSFLGRSRGLGLPDTVEINLAAAGHGWGGQPTAPMTRAGLVSSIGFALVTC
jgi:hypothetical protein